MICSTLFKASSLELYKLSTTTTSYPAFKSSTHVWLPIYPAPPATKIAMISPPLLYILFIYTIFYHTTFHDIIKVFLVKQLLGTRLSLNLSSFNIITFFTSMSHGKCLSWQCSVCHHAWKQLIFLHCWKFNSYRLLFF